MRKLYFLSLLLILISCSSEEEEVSCVAPLFDKNIIGSWDVTSTDLSQLSTVTFRSDGTGTNNSAEGPFIYYCRLNDEDIKDFKWRLDTLGDTEYFFLKYRNTNCSQDNGHLILANECEKIELSGGIQMITLARE